jgi:ATP-dependent exoDNAse (exonuclease V) beta subunit
MSHTIEIKIPSLDIKDKFTLPLELLKGIQSSLSDKELHIQEEKRLMYVAITRAMDKLYLTYAKKNRNNLTNSKPSRLLDDLKYTENSCIKYEVFDFEKPQVEELDASNEQTKITRKMVADINTGKYQNAIEKILFFAKTKSMDINNLQYDIRCIAQASLYFERTLEMTAFMTALTEKVTEMTDELTVLTNEMTMAITIFFIKVFDHDILYKISDSTSSSSPSHQNTSDTGIPQWKNKGFNI